MFFAASKILVWFIYPLSLGILLLILAYVAALVRRKAFLHFLLLVAILILYLFSVKPVAVFLLTPLERRHLSVNPSELKADAIVVLSGDTRKKVFPRSDIEVHGNRVIKAIRLYKQGAAPIIVMTGGSGSLFDQNFREAVSMKKFAVEFDVPADKIIIETESRNTRENLLYTKQILNKIKAKRVILVTSASHLPRSYALFKKVGIDAVPVASDFYATDERYDPFSFIPDSSSLSLSSIAIKEYVGILVYWLMGWI